MHKLQGPGNCAGSEKSVETDELVVIHVGCYVFVEFHEQQNFLRHFIHFRISKHQTEVPEIIFKPMSYKNSVGVDEPHQIILHLLQVLRRAILWGQKALRNEDIHFRVFDLILSRDFERVKLRQASLI